MTDAVLHRAGGRDQRLAQHLPAEDALPAVLGRDAAEDVRPRSARDRAATTAQPEIAARRLPGGAVRRCGRILAHWSSVWKVGEEPRKAAESPASFAVEPQADRRNSACLGTVSAWKRGAETSRNPRMGNVLLATRRASAARDHQARRAGTPVHADVQGLRLQPDLGRSGGRPRGAGAQAASPADHHRVGRLQRPQLSRGGTRAHHRGRSQSEPCRADAAEAAGVRASARPRRRSSASSATPTTRRTATCSTIS